MRKNPEGKVAVHCQQGINRAPTVAIALLMTIDGMSLHDAATLVKSKFVVVHNHIILVRCIFFMRCFSFKHRRPYVSPCPQYLTQLLSLELQLTGSPSISRGELFRMFRRWRITKKTSFHRRIIMCRSLTKLTVISLSWQDCSFLSFLHQEYCVSLHYSSHGYSCLWSIISALRLMKLMHYLKLHLSPSTVWLIDCCVGLTDWLFFFFFFFSNTFGCSHFCFGFCVNQLHPQSLA